MTSQPDMFGPKWRPHDFDETKLTTEEARVLGYLKFHVGAARAIKIEWIENTGIADRQVRQILKHLTEEHGVAIASSIKPPYGVYLVETAEELEEYCKQLQGRALSALRRMAILRRQHLGELLGQIRLEAEGQAQGPPEADQPRAEPALHRGGQAQGPEADGQAQGPPEADQPQAEPAPTGKAE